MTTPRYWFSGNKILWIKQNRSKRGILPTLLAYFCHLGVHLIDIESYNEEGKAHCDLAFVEVTEAAVCHVELHLPEDGFGFGTLPSSICLSPSSDVRSSCIFRLYWFSRWLVSIVCLFVCLLLLYSRKVTTDSSGRSGWHFRCDSRWLFFLTSSMRHPN